MLWWLAACTAVRTMPDLEVEGLGPDGLSGNGVWIEETVVYRDGTTEVMHKFLLLSEPLSCPDVDLLYSDAEVSTVGMSAEERCEAEKASYAALAERPGYGAGLKVSMALWDTRRDGDHIGVLPEDATYTELGGPDEAPVEHSTLVSRRTGNYHAAIAEGLDCSQPDVWPPVRARDFGSGLTDVLGTWSFEAGRDTYEAELDLQVVGDLRGTLRGRALFERCPATRVLGPAAPAG